MKTLSFLTLFLATNLLAAPRVITLETQKIDDAVHWMPATVEVTQGETVKFVLHHDLEGGFDFHGFFVPVLKDKHGKPVSEQVDRKKAKEIEVKIPKDLKPGEYDIGCHFHPKHVPAKLVVKEAKKTG